jgi:hypothetical protein
MHLSEPSSEFFQRTIKHDVMGVTPLADAKPFHDAQFQTIDKKFVENFQ